MDFKRWGVGIGTGALASERIHNGYIKRNQLRLEQERIKLQRRDQQLKAIDQKAKIDRMYNAGQITAYDKMERFKEINKIIFESSDEGSSDEKSPRDVSYSFTISENPLFSDTNKINGVLNTVSYTTKYKKIKNKDSYNNLWLSTSKNTENDSFELEPYPTTSIIFAGIVGTIAGVFFYQAIIYLINLIFTRLERLKNMK